MIIVKNEKNEYMCGRIKNPKSITKNIEEAMKFDTKEEARDFVWHYEWKTRNDCEAIYVEI